MCIRYYEGRHIYFRPVELADQARLGRWVNDPANWKTLGRFRPVNERGEREYIERLYESGEDLALAVVLSKGDQMIGIAGLRQINAVNRSAVFGLLIGDRSFQSRGFGTEATRLMVRYGFEELNLNRIGLRVQASHQRAIRAYRRAGFVEEGRLGQACFRNGRYHDELCLAILRQDWERQLQCDDHAVEQDGSPVLEPAAMTMWDTRIET